MSFETVNKQTNKHKTQQSPCILHLGPLRATAGSFFTNNVPCIIASKLNPVTEATKFFFPMGHRETHPSGSPGICPPTMLRSHNSKQLAFQGWSWLPWAARGGGGASSHIPDPLSHPFPPPPLPPTPRLAVRAPVLGVIREPNLDHRRRVHRVSGIAGDPEKAPPPRHTHGYSRV